MQWKLSDDQFIARIRWWQRHRRTLGIIIIALGLLFGAAVIWEFHFVSRELVSLSQSMQTVGHPTTQQIIGAGINNIKFMFGFTLGLAAGIGFLVAIEGVTRGIVLMGGWTSRRDQLLLKLWDSREHPNPS